MSWLYQPLPLASSFTVSDVSVDLDNEDASATSTLETGTAVPGINALLSGSQSLSEHGFMDLGDTSETIAGSEVATAQQSMAVNTLSVRLRSRKVGGASTAENILQSQVIGMSQGTATNVVSVLLGGTGVTTAQQSLTKTTARLLTGQVRTTHQGTLTYVPQSGAGLPSWVQLPTQVEEAAFYDTAFPLGSGKEVAWNYVTSDRTPTFSQGGFASTVAIPVSIDLHNETEGDNLWNHYMQYKRTGEQRYLDWATGWRNYYVDGSYQSDLLSCGSPVYDHMYCQGLVVWAMERNDLPAKNKALALIALIESNVLGLVPGFNAPSFDESRRFARHLINLCYITMMEPITRWITCRDHLIECWVQSGGWRDTTSSFAPTVIGGNHFAGPTTHGGWTSTQQSQGFRWNHSFEYALHTEGLWLAYKLTGRQDIRDMLVQMGRYILHYAWDPAFVNPFSGSRWGHRPAGTAPRGTDYMLHDYADEYVISPPGVVQNPLPTMHDDVDYASSTNYEITHVNTLVYAYKLTGELPFLKRAREHLRKATQYQFATTVGPANPKESDIELNHFLDTRRDSSPWNFAWNKGELQYAAYIFENGGVPTLESGTTWTPAYPVPTSPGEVVLIAGQEAEFIAGKPAQGGGSQWPTNCPGDIGPAEISASRASMMMTSGDAGGAYVRSFSQGGAYVAAGGGGHIGQMNLGAMLFDFEDATWKRIWTGGITSGNVDRRLDTRVHNCKHYFGDLVEAYSSNSHSSFVCWNHNHWTPTPDQQAKCPREPDPRDQVFEITRREPTAEIMESTTECWQLPGEWAGLQTSVTGETFGGLIGNCLRFQPTVGEPIPAPGHTWHLNFEVPTDDGGGPKGSVAFARSTYMGYGSTIALNWSYRFDLDTGTWHKYSVNTSRPGTNDPVSGGGPHDLAGATAGAYDPVTNRVYMVDQNGGSSTRINYMNLSDRTWRNLNLGAETTETGRSESLVVDPDRRLLLLHCETAPFLRVFNLATLDHPTLPTTGTGGWDAVPITITDSGLTSGGYPSQWTYYPPNGKFYQAYSRALPKASTPAAYNTANDLSFSLLRRISPPAINAAAHAADPSYYMNQPWTADRITLSRPLARPGYKSQFSSVGSGDRFIYVPPLQCLAWLPTDNDEADVPVTTRRCVYLIKPF